MAWYFEKFDRYWSFSIQHPGDPVVEALWLYTVENLRNDLTPQVAKGGSLALLTSASNACLDTKPKNIMKDKKKKSTECKNAKTTGGKKSPAIHLCLQGMPGNQAPAYKKKIGIQKKKIKVRSLKKNDIIWEFFPNVGPPPIPPFWEPLIQKKFLVFILHFRT